MNRLILGISLFCVAALTWAQPGLSYEKKQLAVGIVQNWPIVYVDHEGVPRGLFVDILDEIARLENWDLTYVHKPWAQCVEDVRTGNIDLMTTIAFSEERNEFMDFARENLISIWGQVYVKPNSPIRNFQDLDGKTVAVLKNGINGINFRRLIRNLGLECTILEVKDYDTVVDLVVRGKAHAGVTNNVTGYLLEQKYDILRSPIMFEPLKLGFSTPKGSHDDIRIALDAHLSEWKKDKESFYYSVLDRHYGTDMATALPRWLVHVLTIGGTLLVVAFFFVISLRQQVGKRTSQLQENEEKYRLIFDESPLALVHIDPESRITACNHNLAKIMGQPRENMIGTHLLSTVDDPQMHTAITQALSGKTGRYQGDFSTDASHIQTPLNGYFSPLFTRGGKVLGAVGLFEDITHVKKAEEKKVMLETKLRQVQKLEAVGCLAGGIAHDFNNILSSIIGYSEMALQDAPPKSVLASDLKKIFQAGERAKELVKQILTFSRQGEQTRQAVRIQSIIKEALKLLRPSIPATIDIRMEVDPNCSPVFADPTQIHQVVVNLCTNAYQAMIKTGGTLTVGLSQEFPLPGQAREGPLNVNSLRLTVTDSGDGIPKRYLDKIFDPYFTTKPKEKGTGLGLSIVHGIVKSCMGDIQVKSTRGEGTCFTIFLPAMEDQDAPPAPPVQEAVPMGREHILMVDDDENVVWLHKAMLLKLGYKVTATADSTAALEVFRRSPQAFDLVITDMAMPGYSGADLAEQMMALRPDIPIVICTGYSETIDAEKARKMGVKAYVMKPVIQGKLARTVREVLDALPVE